MKKKFFTLFLTLVSYAGTMFASVVIDGIAYNLNETELTAEVSGGYFEGNIVIPASVTYESKTYTVTSIGDDAFRGRTSLTSVTIPNSVTSIGNNAFSDSYNLFYVTIPNSVISIGEYAFSDCENLMSITIPYSVTSIGIKPFSGCRSLPVIDNIRYADTYLVEAVDKTLSSYTIREGTRFVGSGAFEKSGLTSITIPNSVTNIEENAFSGCSSLTSITIPNSVTSIDERAFEKSGLTSITIPNSVTSIVDYAFFYCSSLTSITIPNSVTSIGYQSFAGCSSLIQVNITDLAAWCKISFSYSSSNPLESAHHLYLNGTEITDLVIPNSVDTIASYAFKGCKGLTSIKIPGSVKYIRESAFMSCEELTSIELGYGVKRLEKLAFWDSAPKILSISSTIDSIADDAFYPSRLEICYNYSETPQEIDPNESSAGMYRSILALATLYVPAQSVDTYKSAPLWRFFGNILPLQKQEDKSENIDNIDATRLDNGNKLLHDGQIFILRGDKTYTITGQEVKYPPL